MQGATVVDFAYHVHTDVGNQMVGVKARPTACMRTALGVRALACGLPGSARGVSPVSMACIGWSTKSACGDQHTSRCAHPRSVTGRVRARQVNGKLVELSHALANAEVVEVLTYPGPPTALTVQRHQVRARACCLGLPRSRARACGRRRAAPALDVPGRMGLCTQQDTAGRGRLPDGQAALSCPQASLIAPAALPRRLLRCEARGLTRRCGAQTWVKYAQTKTARHKLAKFLREHTHLLPKPAPAPETAAPPPAGRGARGEGRGGAAGAGPVADGQMTWLVVQCSDRPGLLADIALAIAEHGHNITARSCTWTGCSPPVCGACMPERSASASSWCWRARAARVQGVSCRLLGGARRRRRLRGAGRARADVPRGRRPGGRARRLPHGVPAGGLPRAHARAVRRGRRHARRARLVALLRLAGRRGGPRQRKYLAALARAAASRAARRRAWGAGPRAVLLKGWVPRLARAQRGGERTGVGCFA